MYFIKKYKGTVPGLAGTVFLCTGVRKEISSFAARTPRGG